MPPPHTPSTSLVASRLAPFGTSIFAEITARSHAAGAVNLGQGMPDSDGPDWVKDAAIRAMMEKPNQYVPMPGVPALREAIADRFESTGGGRRPDPDAEITVTSGCTEALAACMLGLLNPGDEVIVFEPFYDAYLADLAMAGAVPVFVPLRFQSDGTFAFDANELAKAVTAKTRAVLLNTPHNPTGKVFDRSELESIAQIAQRHDLIVFSDEVYDSHVYVGEHLRIAAIDGMASRTVTLGSFGKMFSMTGWKIGWAIAPPSLTAGVRASHQFLTYCVAAPLQHAAAEALRADQSYYTELCARFGAQRDRLADGLHTLGFRFATPAGGYFILADHTPVSGPRLGEGTTDVAFCHHLIEHAGVATIPPSSFYKQSDEGTRLLRFAFCVSASHIDDAVTRLTAWTQQPTRP
ncbi:MAG: aspartate/methionine/tyrosine aminotransferase [Phycisphaerales bacterium]|jgi:aspartate/methionine/tyrosine aminotransferase